MQRPPGDSLRQSTQSAVLDCEADGSAAGDSTAMASTEAIKSKHTLPTVPSHRRNPKPTSNHDRNRRQRHHPRHQRVITLHAHRPATAHRLFSVSLSVDIGLGDMDTSSGRRRLGEPPVKSYGCGTLPGRASFFFLNFHAPFGWPCYAMPCHAMRCRAMSALGVCTTAAGKLWYWWFLRKSPEPAAAAAGQLCFFLCWAGLGTGSHTGLAIWDLSQILYLLGPSSTTIKRAC